MPTALHGFHIHSCGQQLLPLFFFNTDQHFHWWWESWGSLHFRMNVRLFNCSLQVLAEGLQTTLVLWASGMWAIIDVLFFLSKMSFCFCFFLTKVKHFSVVGWCIIRNWTQEFQTFSSQIYNFHRTVYHHKGDPHGLESMNDVQCGGPLVFISGINIVFSLISAIFIEFQ